MLSERLDRVEIKNKSGIRLTDGDVSPVSNKHYEVANLSVGGDAPKDVIRLYQYEGGEIREGKPNSWPLYIAKVEQKWYPNESVTEHFMTRIGELFGFKMASSKLVKINDQVRFLSKHFLGNNEQLVHGAQIFGGYLNDKDFVDKVREKKMSKDIFTFDFISEAIKNVFSFDVADSLIRGYVRMLSFDAIAGNNDRHHANWGVVKHVLGKKEPRFAPIYDSARGLFWNHPDSRLRSKIASGAKKTDEYISSYVKGARPMTSWSQQGGSLNHFQLLRALLQEYPEYESLVEDHYRPDALSRLHDELEDGEFANLMCDARSHVVIQCLRQRLKNYQKVLSG